MKRQSQIAFVLLLGLFTSGCSRTRSGGTPSESPSPTTNDHPTSGSASDSSQQPVQCGSVTCPAGQVCCNASCGTCTEPGGMCTQQFCEHANGADAATPPSTGSTCASDADCRTFSDYCTGCNCRALARSAPDPTCSGPGVRCIADPCMRHTAACDPATHACVLR